MSSRLFTALWHADQGTRYVWYDADWPSFRAKALDLAAQGMTLRSLDAVDDDASSWAGVWDGAASQQEFAADQTWTELATRTATLAAQGLQLWLLRCQGVATTPRWAACWRSGTGATVTFAPAAWDVFWSHWLAQHAAGNRLVDFDTFEQGGVRQWAGVWAPGSQDEFMWVQCHWDEFARKNDELRASGFGLWRVASYESGADRRWAGVWRTGLPGASLVTDMTADELWARWDAELASGRRLSQLDVWSGTGYAPKSARKVTLRLHIKVLSEPTIPIASMLDRMREVYEPIGITVDVASVETLDRPELLDVDAGGCSNESISAEQQQLFAARASASAMDVVVYFVRSTLPPYNGCAAYPAGRPGAIIASYASEWTLAHEIGHVLGLYHVMDLHRLMTGQGTANIVDPPPDLLPMEVATMLSSPYVVAQ
jgi:hypothetical protein